MLTFFELILVGFFIGGVAGVTGASGVLIMVPIFSTFFDIPLPIILGVSLLVDVIASISISLSYARAGNLLIREVLWLLVGSLLGAQVGSFFVLSLSPILIMFVIASGMFYFGFKMWKNGISKPDGKKFLVVPDKVSDFAKTPFGMLLSGLIVGLSTGLFGAGGGLTIFIILYSFLKFPIKKAIGTSSFIMLFTALSGVLGYFNQGNLDFTLGAIIGLSAAIGGVFSSIIANKIEENTLAKVVGSFFLFLSIVVFVLKVTLPFLEKYF